MSYHIYTTSGIILKRTPIGESDVYLHVLTRDLGLIVASAKSVRTPASKLRQALIEYNLVNVSCIKGKNGWKITNVVSEESYYYDMPRDKHRVVSQVSQVLIKMMPGESEHTEVFEIVKNSFTFLKNLKNDLIKNFEVVVVLRILKELGYIAKNKDTDQYTSDLNFWSEDLLLALENNKKIILESINKAFKESHL